MDTFVDAVLKELPDFISSLVLLLLAWRFGLGLSVRWNIRQKRREDDLAAAREFHGLYGEFFTVWKLWNYVVRDVGADALPGASRWELLKRACDAEGRFESLLVRLSCDRRLGAAGVELLGRYRQLYQCLRQAIRDGKPLRWDSSEHPDYQAFKNLAPEIAALIVAEDPQGLPPAKAAEAFRAITSKKWE